MFSTGGAAAGPLGPRFRLLWTSVTVSALGDGMRFVALPLLAARISGDPRDLALVAVAEQLPWLLLSLPAGALADRVDRRRLLWTVDACRAVLAAGFAITVALGVARIPLIALVGFLLGCGQTLYNAGWAGVVPAVVRPADRPRANGRLQAGALVTDSLLGAPLGTVCFGLAALAPFAVDALSFALAAVLVFLLPGSLRVRRPEPLTDRQAARGLLAEAAEGARWLARHRLLRALCLAAATANLVFGGVLAVLVLYAREVLRLGAVGYGLLVAAFAVGGVLGSLAAPRLGRLLGTRWTLLVTMLGSGLALTVAGLTGSWLPAGCATVGYGALSMAWGVLAVSLRQDLVPEQLLGRVSMAYQMVANGGLAVGAALAGELAHAYGLRAPFLAGAALTVLAAPPLYHVLSSRQAAACAPVGTASAAPPTVGGSADARASRRTSGTASTSSDSSVMPPAQAQSAPFRPSPPASGAAAAVPTGASATEPHQS
ncbi:MFS family permease [Kitasatospora sp. GAS204A]|nr:MFS family permease [Kitasatospora sp. GAS204B]